MTDLQTVKGRLIAFIKYLELGQGKFEARCGLANGYVNNIRRSVTPDKLQQIALQFPQLNTGWLMTGEGEMLRKSVTQTSYGDNSPNVNGDNNHVNVSTSSDANQEQDSELTITQVFNELIEQRKVTEKVQAQLDTAQAHIGKLIALLEMQHS